MLPGRCALHTGVLRGLMSAPVAAARVSDVRCGRVPATATTSATTSKLVKDRSASTCQVVSAYRHQGHSVRPCVSNHRMQLCRAAGHHLAGWLAGCWWPPPTYPEGPQVGKSSHVVGGTQAAHTPWHSHV
jgi:hypothetical protein